MVNLLPLNEIQSKRWLNISTKPRPRAALLPSRIILGPLLIRNLLVKCLWINRSLNNLLSPLVPKWSGGEEVRLLYPTPSIHVLESSEKQPIERCLVRNILAFFDVELREIALGVQS